MVVSAAPSSPLSIKIGDITGKLLSMGRRQDVPGEGTTKTTSVLSSGTN